MRETRDSRTIDPKFALREKNFVVPGMAAAQSVCKKRGREFRAREKRENRARGAPTQARAKMKLKAGALI